VKVLIISSKCSLLDATIFKPIILAGMPESSHRDVIGYAILGSGLRHPCRSDGNTLIFNNSSCRTQITLVDTTLIYLHHHNLHALTARNR
jgi:hypothetical protein